MLLDSDSSLKVAHDICHDVNELVRPHDPESVPHKLPKWAQLLAAPDDPRLPEDSTVPLGYVEFEYADGSVFRVPCVWNIMMGAEGATREKIIFRKNGNVTTWAIATKGSAIGAFSGVFSDGPIKMGALDVERLIALDSAEYANALSLIMPEIAELAGRTISAFDLTIGVFGATETAEIVDSTYNDVYAPDGEADIQDSRLDEISATELICTGEQIAPVEEFNAWFPGSGPHPETPAKYTTYIPFEAISATGGPINGYDKPLVDNPFYPDFIYMDKGSSPWDSKFAWVPSATRPSVPYWQDVDGIYWYKVRVGTSASRFGSPNLIWPVRTCNGEAGVDVTTPPLKAEADGMIVTVKSFATTPAFVCLTDKYTFESENGWNWYPGTLREIKGKRVCQFMAKREFTWFDNKIVAVEYQFLPLGDMDG